MSANNALCKTKALSKRRGEAFFVYENFLLSTLVPYVFASFGSYALRVGTFRSAIMVYKCQCLSHYLEHHMSSPMRILAVDVGTGTQDILLFESGKTIENCFKLVMPSPTVIVAERIKRATERGQPLILTGVTMGGGPCHWAAPDHALAGCRVA